MSHIKVYQPKDMSGIAPIEKGGFFAETKPEAVKNIGLLTKATLDVAQGTAVSDEVGGLKLENIPTGLRMPELPTVYGPLSIVAGFSEEYVITNFDISKTYLLTVSKGTVTRNLDRLTITAPLTGEDIQLTVNGTVFLIDTLPERVTAPVVQYPIDETEIFFHPSLLVSMDSFQTTLITGSHASTQVQVSEQPDFSTTVFDQTSATQLTGFEVTGLVSLKNYYLRTRFISALGTYSDWSETVAFKMKAVEDGVAFNVPGTHTFTIPNTTAGLEGSAIASGGGGDYASAGTNLCGGGGASGSMREISYTPVPAGSTITVIVPPGGKGGISKGNYPAGGIQQSTQYRASTNGAAARVILNGTEIATTVGGNRAVGANGGSAGNGASPGTNGTASAPGRGGNVARGLGIDSVNTGTTRHPPAGGKGFHGSGGNGAGTQLVDGLYSLVAGDGGAGFVQLAFKKLADIQPSKPTLTTVGTGIVMGEVRGEAVFNTPGTYQWTAPMGVYSVCAVAVGAGAGGESLRGGGGAGLGWKNNIPVTPGQTYTVQVGKGGIAPVGILATNATDGSDSFFIDIGTVAGLGGKSDKNANKAVGGGFVGDGGGNGGKSTNGRGGGGAGGYNGPGGNGGLDWPTAGQGGSAGGGSVLNTTGTEENGNHYPVAGGGVGIFGQGDSATGGPVSIDASINIDQYRYGRAGSGGEDGRWTTDGWHTSSGGKYGGGGGHMGEGGDGAVRIVWGENISFPTNAAQITDPSTGTAPVDSTIDFATSPYAVTASLPHLNTDWEIATDANFTTVVLRSDDDAVNLTQWRVSGLTRDIRHYARARHANAYAISEWSNVLEFIVSPTEIEYLTPGTYTLTIPAGIMAMDVPFLVAGGGAGGYGMQEGAGEGSVPWGKGGGGGAGSGVKSTMSVPVVPGDIIRITVGAGAPGFRIGIHPTIGGDSVVLKNGINLVTQLGAYSGGYNRNHFGEAGLGRDGGTSGQDGIQARSDSVNPVYYAPGGAGGAGIQTPAGERGKGGVGLPAPFDFATYTQSGGNGYAKIKLIPYTKPNKPTAYGGYQGNDNGFYNFMVSISPFSSNVAGDYPILAEIEMYRGSSSSVSERVTFSRGVSSGLGFYSADATESVRTRGRWLGASGYSDWSDF